MSIIASIKVYDGLVLAADSMTTIIGEEVSSGIKGVVKTYEFSNKLFQLKSLPVGLLTYGIGNIAQRSIESLLNEFMRKYDEIRGNTSENKHKIENITQRLLDFLRGVYKDFFKEIPEENMPKLGVLVGGYSPDSVFAEEWEFILPNFDEIKLVRSTDNFGASWRGIVIPFTRLYRGIDPRTEQLLIKEGVSPDIVKKAHYAFESPIIFDGMPVQDAIDLAKFIIETTIGLSRFEAGPPSCGGPIDIAVILPDKQFKWIQKKELRS
ncbi:MAG: hypothetical protein HQ591_03445 [candidate division Zixibacteria bacterium]|nr:hypothetical protein [Candidatus Tariuqbacter arcticus]